VEELEKTFAALADGLHRIEFYKAREPGAILRTLRTVISRAEPDLQEAGLLRAIGFEIGKHLVRVEEEGRSGQNGGGGLTEPGQE